MRDRDKTILLMISKVLSSVSVLLLSILFARLLSKEEYGTYIQVNMIVQLLGVVLAFGLPASFYYFLPKDFNRSKLLLRTALIQVLVGSVAIILLLFWQKNVGAFLNNPSLVKYIKFAGVCVFCSLFIDFIMPVLLYRQATITLAKINIFRSVVMFASMASCLFWQFGLTAIIIVFTCNYVLGLSISAVILFRDIKLYTSDAGRNNVKLLNQLKYSLPLSLSIVFWLLGREIDKYIVSHYLTPETLAVYARGAMELPLVHIVANTVAQVNLTRWVEMWDHGERKTLLQQWHVSIAKTATIMFPIFIFFEIVGYDFIVFLYSEAYAKSVTIFLIYLLLVPLQITSYTSYVQATGHNRYILYGYVGQIAFNIIASIYAIKHFGTIGPAVVTVMGMYVWTIFMVVVIGKIFTIRFFDIFPWRLLAKIMAISFVSGILPALFSVISGSGTLLGLAGGFSHELTILIKMSLLGLAYGFSYFWCAYKFGILDDDDRETIYRWLMLNKLRRLYHWS